ncbi:unnamed protein product, partial [Rotaria magnacalcarata]
MNKINEDDQTLVRPKRPSSFGLELQIMDIDTDDKTLVIDLCTSDVDIGEIETASENENITLTSKTLIERFPNLGNQLPILPCYPTNDKYAHGDPLLPNISPHRLTRTELARRQLGTFTSEFDFITKVDMFYMKTCSLRYARPRTLNEGLFCLQEPEARYELSACGNCALCYPQYDRTYRVKKSIVGFSQAHQHTFLNGYHAILNFSASCHTYNIIYALTCPCGNVDYIGE